MLAAQAVVSHPMASIAPLSDKLLRVIYILVFTLSLSLKAKRAADESSPPFAQSAKQKKWSFGISLRAMEEERQ